MKRFTLINKYKNILNDVINNLNLNKKDKRERPNKFEKYFYLNYIKNFILWGILEYF